MYNLIRVVLNSRYGILGRSSNKSYLELYLDEISRVENLIDKYRDDPSKNVSHMIETVEQAMTLLCTKKDDKGALEEFITVYTLLKSYE